MIAGIVAKIVIDIIEKADDKRIARSFHKRLKALEKDSHPRADWICMDCGCKAKKIEKPTRRKNG
tara:strand:- start:568 stop:762 length:195 start_codon:yes stop_codon:yes gene_type:complete